MLEPMNDMDLQQFDPDFLAKQILDHINSHPECQSDPSINDFSTKDFDDYLTKLSDQTQSVQISSGAYHTMELQDNQYPLNMSQDNLKNNYLIQPQSDPIDRFIDSENSTQPTKLSIEPTTIDNKILTESILSEQLSMKQVKGHRNQSTTVTPVETISNPNEHILCDTRQMRHNIPYSNKQLRQQNLIKAEKIRMRCQPRPHYRPRTLNESLNTSHYIRCEDGAEQEYPTINIPQSWACQSYLNVIEVALVDIKKELHPYCINNKTSKNSLEDDVLIIKKNEPNILYFRLTNEDFLSGLKSFKIELIKSKQSTDLVKKTIRDRKLNQSMLRFTRIYGDEYGELQRDSGSEEYSWIMTESYGDVAVEHVGSRYGPMCGQEMVFIVLKGRIVKDDISINISEQTTRWLQEIKNFTLIGNVIHFTMPPFPYPQLTRVKASINILFKQHKLHESKYLYISTLDQELINLNDTTSDMFVSMALNDFHNNMITNEYPMPVIPKRTAKNKSRKRLNSK